MAAAGAGLYPYPGAVRRADAKRITAPSSPRWKPMIAPVHVHCIMNWRVSAFFCRYHREDGMAEAEARALMHEDVGPGDKRLSECGQMGRLRCGRENA